MTVNPNTGIAHRVQQPPHLLLEMTAIHFFKCYMYNLYTFHLLYAANSKMH